MKKFTILVSAFSLLALGAVSTSCVKDNESQSVTDIRTAKAAQLNALAALAKADAEAAIISANADAELKKAQAALENAKAAYQQAQTEDKKAELEAAKAEYEVRKQEAIKTLSQTLHDAKIAEMGRQAAMAKAQQELEMALATNMNAKLRYYSNAYKNLISSNPNVQILDYSTKQVVVYSGLGYISDQILSTKMDLFNAEWDLTDDKYTVSNNIADKNRAIAVNEALLAQYKAQSDLGYDGFLAEAKKYDQLNKDGVVKLSDLNNKVTQATEKFRLAADGAESGNKPAGAMYLSEFATAARLLNQMIWDNNSTQVIVNEDLVPTKSKEYEILGKKADYDNYSPLRHYTTVNSSELEVLITNFEKTRKTSYQNQLATAEANVLSEQAVYNKLEKEYNDSIAVRDSRTDVKNKTAAAATATQKAFNDANTALTNAQTAYAKAAQDTPFSPQNVSNAAAVDAAIANTKAVNPQTAATIAELAVLEKLKTAFKAQSDAVTANDKAQNAAGVAYTTWTNNTNKSEALYNQIKTSGRSLNGYKTQVTEFTDKLANLPEESAKLRAAQKVVNDATKKADYEKLCDAAQAIRIGELADAQIAVMVQSANNSYNAAMSNQYNSLATNIFNVPGANFQNMIEEAIKSTEHVIAGLKNDIARLEQFGNQSTINKADLVAYYKELIAQLEAEYTNTQKVADNFKKLLEAELNKQ